VAWEWFGGFTVFNNKLYILGGFDTITTEGKGPARSGVYSLPLQQKAAVLPVPLGYLPTTTTGTSLHRWGRDITAGVLTDTRTPLSMIRGGQHFHHCSHTGPQARRERLTSMV
jgi:hypothetical protein